MCAVSSEGGCSLTMESTKVDEVMGFFDELLGLCSGDDVAVSEDSRKLQLLQQQLSELFSKRIELMKLDVDAVQRECDKLEGDLSGEPAGSGAAVGVGAAWDELAAARQRRDAVLEEVTRLRAATATCRDERDTLVTRRQALSHYTGNTIPRRRHEMNLCLYLSGIRWQDGDKPNDIVGYVSNKGSVKPFCLDNNQNSKFFIANYLWDLMQVDW